VVSPTRLGKFEIISKLGQGAMGIVYQARDTRLDRLVALKTMSPTVAADPELVQRFYREAQSAGQLQHANIVTIFDVDEADGVPFIAMEFLAGRTLEKIISSHEELAMVSKFDIVIQICRGLNYAHEHGVVHRDVKPANIIVMKDGRAKILDFGIAQIAAASITRTGLVLGTPAYMSPEQISGETIDRRSDIYAMGVILYELLTYKKPFQEQNLVRLRTKILCEDPEPLSNALPNCPPQLERVVAKALAKRRQDRYDTAADFALDLQQVSDFFRDHQVRIYVEEGRRSLDEGNLTVAREALQKALQIDSGHDLAKNLLKEVQEQISARRRAQEIDQHLRQAKQALQAEQFDEAIALLDRIQQLEPGHQSALEYRRLAVERRDRLQKIRLHMERAGKFAIDADLKSAKAELEAVLKLDREHDGATRLLDWVMKELAEMERQRQVLELIQDARARLARNHFDGAMDFLERALKLDPVNIEAEALIRQVRSVQKKEEERQRRESRLVDIQAALDAREYDRAVALADKALEEFPDDPRILKRRTQSARLAELESRKRLVDERLGTASDLVRQGKHADAIAVLQDALEMAPDDVRLLSSLRTVKEAQERQAVEALVQQALREANQLVREKDFSLAIETLEKAIARAGDVSDLVEALQIARDLQSEQRRKERTDQVLSQAERFIVDENYEEAVRVLEKSRRQLSSPEVDTLLATTCEQQRKSNQRGQAILGQGRQLLEAGEAVKAAAVLDAAPKHYQKSEEFRQLYARCREGLDRATLIRSTLDQFEGHFKAIDFDEADRVLNQAFKTYPKDPELLAARGRLEAERLRLRRIEWAKRLDDARVALSHLEYGRAIEILVVLSPELTQAPELATEAKALLDEARISEHKLDLQRRAIQKANEQIGAKGFSAAITILEQALATVGESPELLERLRFARDLRQERIREVIAAAQSSLREENYEDVIRMLEQARRELGASELDELLATVTKQQEGFKSRRETTLKAALQLLEEGEAAKAVALLEAAPKAYLGDADFQRAFARCREGLDRATFVRSMLGQIDADLASADVSRAEKMLQQALGKYPNEPSLLDAQRRLREMQARLRRTEAERLLKESKAAVDRMDYAQATEILTSVTAELSSEPALASKAKALKESIRRGERQLASRERAVREAKAQVDKRDFTAAIVTLEKAMAAAGESPELLGLLRRARDQQQKELVAQVLSRARALLRDDSYGEAIRVLENAQREIGASEIEIQLAAVREQQQAFDRRCAEMQEQARQLLTAGESGRALALLDSAPQTYFRDEQFQRLYAQCREESDRVTAVRTTLDQFEQYLVSENLERAQALLESALRVYRDEPKLIEAQQRLREEQAHVQRRAWVRMIDEAKIAMGRMEYAKATQILTSLPAGLADAPELAAEVTALLDEARAGELAQRQRVIATPVPPEQRAEQGKLRSSRATAGALAAVAVLFIVAIGVWRMRSPFHPPPKPNEQNTTKGGAGTSPTGWVEINAVPWADILEVETAEGKPLNISGQTPVEISLPSGHYRITLRYGGYTRQVEVAVQPGAVSSADYTFPEVKIDEVVDGLLSAR
jgi:eukaryotic-like serine/threonine-protein kinase